MMTQLAQSLRAAAVACALTLAVSGQAVPSRGKPAPKLKPTLPVLSGKEAVDRCMKAYRSLESYSGTTRVTEQIGNVRGEFRAFIRYQEPDRFLITGNERGGTDYAIVVDGTASWIRKHDTGNRWIQSKDPMHHIVVMAGATYGAASSVPALLVEQDKLATLAAYPKVAPRAVEALLNGRWVYRVDVRNEAVEASFWIDPKSFLLLQKQTTTRLDGGRARQLNKPLARAYTREVYTGVQTNVPFPPSLFKKPDGDS